MSLIRQVWLLVIGVIVAATLGSVLVSIWTAKTYLSTQLAIKNNDNAQSLALALSQLADDPTLIEVTVAAQFDTGYYRMVRFRSPEGALLVDKQSSARQARAPAWFVSVVPLSAGIGTAAVTNGWKQLGSVEIESQASYAYDSLWDGALRMALWIAFVGVCAGLIARWGVQQIARPLDAVVSQAEALIQRRFVTIEVPHTPELNRLARAMNSMVDRVRSMFSEQTHQLEALHRQASCDVLTGVPHRAHFLASLTETLQREDSHAHGGLFLVRLSGLGAINRSLGRIRTDELLRTVSQALLEEKLAEGSLIGRLNGSDFALLVPTVASVTDTGQALLARIRVVIHGFAPASVAVAGAQWHRGDTVGGVLSAADQALARAEAQGPFSFEAEDDARSLDAPRGEEAWRLGLGAAIAEKRARLVTFPVLDAKGQLLHLECPLRIQLVMDGAFEPAARWLPFALRTGQVARSDETALVLALDAIAQDGLPRGVNVSPLSLNDASFVPRLRSLIAAHPAPKRLLWVEVDEAAVEQQPAGLEELCRQLRPLGVKIGLEHAGHRVAQLGNVLDAGLDYVKLAGSVVSRVARDEARAAHVRGIASVLHGMGVAVYAEGVANEDDLAALWRCRIDGVTGPAVSLSA